MCSASTTTILIFEKPRPLQSPTSQAVDQGVDPSRKPFSTSRSFYGEEWRLANANVDSPHRTKPTSAIASSPSSSYCWEWEISLIQGQNLSKHIPVESSLSHQIGFTQYLV